jgi:hypothetical protein
MDPISLIVAALAAGASAGLTGATKDAVGDAYRGLVNLVRRRFKGRPQAEAALYEHEKDPESWERPLRHELERAQADRDQDVILAAQKLLAQLHPDEAQVGKFNVRVEGNVRGWVQGDHAQVNMTFSEDDG